MQRSIIEIFSNPKQLNQIKIRNITICEINLRFEVYQAKGADEGEQDAERAGRRDEGEEDEDEGAGQGGSDVRRLSRRMRDVLSRRRAYESGRICHVVYSMFCFSQCFFFLKKRSAGDEITTIHFFKGQKDL